MLAHDRPMHTDGLKQAPHHLPADQVEREFRPHPAFIMERKLAQLCLETAERISFLTPLGVRGAVVVSASAKWICFLTRRKVSSPLCRSKNEYAFMGSDLDSGQPTRIADSLVRKKVLCKAPGSKLYCALLSADDDIPPVTILKPPDGR